MKQKYVPHNGHTWQKRKEKSSWSQVTVHTACQRRQPWDGRISKPAKDGITVLKTKNVQTVEAVSVEEQEAKATQSY